ncbi:hypothetical protein B0H16DRAFT_1718159 [Mycena metata]|uniref:MYND-type domain-containing protein n=1 Tax=Mycena metata TaxID=1033252 RepID=A0AAD7JIU7_9AGAR|nr:hypothetical protein B0H16DRAFT_1718159 [Mycena metata]
MDIKDMNQDIALLIREMMEQEGKLIAFALEDLVYGALEADWAALDAKKKNEIVLEGLYRGACYAPRDNSRISCPEMTIPGLAGDGEYSFINMLKHLVDHDPTGNRRVKELLIFSHPYTDHQFRHTDGASDTIKATLYLSVILRNYYIVETLMGTLEAYASRYIALARKLLTSSLASKARSATETRKQDKRTFDAEFKASGQYVDNSQCKEEAAIAVYACYGCRLPKERDLLKSCGRCRLLTPHGECAKNDWKSHKKFCGRESFDPALLVPTPDPPSYFIGCPDPAGGFIRTSALWRQIGYLSKPDSQVQDYHFNLAPDHTRSCRILYPPGAQIIFLVARRRAMADGSPAAVNKMFAILRDGCLRGDFNLTLQLISHQLETEYRVKIEGTAGVVGAGAFASPTKRELEEEREYRRQRIATAIFAPKEVGDGDVFTPPTLEQFEMGEALQQQLCPCCMHSR